MRYYRDFKKEADKDQSGWKTRNHEEERAKNKKDMKNPIVATEHIYLNREQTEIVYEDSPEAAFLLAGRHSEIPEWAFEKFDLKKLSAHLFDLLTDEQKSELCKRNHWNSPE